MLSSIMIKASSRVASLGVHRCFSTMNGTVKWFDVKKGFGFIGKLGETWWDDSCCLSKHILTDKCVTVPDDGSSDVFVHQTAIHAEGFRSLAVSPFHYWCLPILTSDTAFTGR